MSDNESQSTVMSDFEDGPEDQNITLIRLVKEREFLYTKYDKRYSDRNITEMTWTQIATQIGWAKDEAKEKWTRLRNNYAKVLARRRTKTPSGSASCGSVKPWIYEAEMEFVKRHVSNSRGMSSSIRVPRQNTATFEAQPQADVSLPLDSLATEPELTLSVAGNGDQATTPKMKRPSKAMDEVDQAM
ncbi:hypothetical protein EGW08_001152 [Elysia chlorotica]|uniref:MADF domain-containing protein n=1 Tax=Elysia chlorotica TaxID=188477 RepID=A0A3S1BTD9_ELYCH|nr:hypothetical protein EGW08_001152 [Elysia chlorotica]